MRLIDADDLRETVLFDNAFSNEVVNYYLDLIDSAETVEAVEPKRGEWISVKDRLPEYNPTEPAKAYWVAYDTNKGKQIQIAIYSDHFLTTITELPPCVTWRDYECHKIKNVTHWMPLPEPPQESDIT